MLRRHGIIWTAFHDLVGAALIALSIALFPLPGPSLPLLLGGIVIIYGKEKAAHMMEEWRRKGSRFFHV